MIVSLANLVYLTIAFNSKSTTANFDFYSETIFGYKGLAVELFYSASRLSTYVNVKYDEIINPAEYDGVQV